MIQKPNFGEIHCKSNLGWFLFRQRLASADSLSSDWVQRAADRQLPMEAAAGAWVVGGWTFLGVGTELHHLQVNSGWWLVWPLLWMITLQAMVLLPAMFLLPITRGLRGSDETLARGIEWGTITLSTLWALRMLFTTSVWSWVLGGIWIIGVITEVLIGVFRWMLLARRDR